MGGLVVEGGGTGGPPVPNWAQLKFEVIVGWRCFIVAWAVSFDSSTQRLTNMKVLFLFFYFLEDVGEVMPLP